MDGMTSARPLDMQFPLDAAVPASPWAAAAGSLTFQELAHIAQGGRPIEKWLRNQIFMGQRRRLPLFRDQLATTFVTLLHKQIDQD